MHRVFNVITLVLAVSLLAGCGVGVDGGEADGVVAPVLEPLQPPMDEGCGSTLLEDAAEYPTQTVRLNI